MNDKVHPKIAARTKLLVLILHSPLRKKPCSPQHKARGISSCLRTNQRCFMGLQASPTLNCIDLIEPDLEREASKLIVRRWLSGAGDNRRLLRDIKKLRRAGLSKGRRISAMVNIANSIVGAKVDIASYPDELGRGAVLTY